MHTLVCLQFIVHAFIAESFELTHLCINMYWCENIANPTLLLDIYMIFTFTSLQHLGSKGMIYNISICTGNSVLENDRSVGSIKRLPLQPSTIIV